MSLGYLSVIQFCFQDFGSFSLSLFRILYQVDSLSLPLWFGGHLSCSFTCWVFLCLFILFILLCLEWPFCILAVCGVLFIVEFSHCGWVGQVASQGFLVKEACVGVLVGEAEFLLSGVQ